ncbi:Reticulon-domain-containing protein [Pseudoneurospora amorphoporcata]|uniref:Reticulon-like protein n=1 Tax=Pseudoneurospora amorphoporcata TaxID=241081 RepID=A0AAN6SDC5_9PEZI|nr:Reticulon-domain-containing protein [Pseudoneurospora amorphoporcata]
MADNYSHADNYSNGSNGSTNLDALKNSKCSTTAPNTTTPATPIIMTLQIAETDRIPIDAASAYDAVTKGPVAQNVTDQGAKTVDEFSNLSASRRTPSTPAATGQPLTHYHSFFPELLSWNNPRASAIAYLSVVAGIFFVRYFDVLRLCFKLTWMVLGVTVAAEVAGKTILNQGFATQLRPRKYYTVSRETLDSAIGDVHQLVNFFVIEAQRVLFAENVYVSGLIALSAFFAYYLVKIVPYWGLALLNTTLAFLGPLVYKTNKEVIDAQIHRASEIIGAQTAQLKTVAQQNTQKATQLTKQYVGEYTAKAQTLVGKATPASLHGEEHTNGHANTHANKSTLRDADFPPAPRADIKTELAAPIEPVVPVTVKSGDMGEPLLLR